MSNFFGGWARYYPFSFIVMLILCIFFGYLMLAVVSPDSWFGQSWETVSKESSRNPELHEDTDHRSRLPWAILLNAFILSTVIWGRLSEYNSSFEGLLIDNHSEWKGKNKKYYFKFSKDGKQFIEEVNKERYDVVKIGDYVKKESKTFGLQITPASDSTDNT